MIEPDYYPLANDSVIIEAIDAMRKEIERRATFTVSINAQSKGSMEVTKWLVQNRALLRDERAEKIRDMINHLDKNTLSIV